MIHISHHACERFVERVQGGTIDEARAAILSHARALETAVGFGCEVVRLGGGERLILERNRVVTVYAAGDLPRQCRSGFRQGGMA